MPGWCHHIDRPGLWRKWTIPAGASCKCVSSLMLADDDDTKCTQVFEYTCPRDATLPAGGGGDANMSPLEDADILQDSASVQMDEAADMSPIRDDDKLPDSAEKVANEEGKKSGRCDSCRLRKKRCDGSHEDCAKNTQLGSDRNGRVQAFEYACPQREAPPLSPSSVPMDVSEDADACVSLIEGVGVPVDAAEKAEHRPVGGRCDSCRLHKKRCDGSHEACAKNTQPGSGRNGKVPAVPRRVDARESEHLKPLGRRERTESYDRATELVRACAHMCAHTRFCMCTHTNRPQHSLACPLACARTDSTREGCSSRKL